MLQLESIPLNEKLPFKKSHIAYELEVVTKKCEVND